jgi:hypothetical protein
MEKGGKPCNFTISQLPVWDVQHAASLCERREFTENDQALSPFQVGTRQNSVFTFK